MIKLTELLALRFQFLLDPLVDPPPTYQSMLLPSAKRESLGTLSSFRLRFNELLETRIQLKSLQQNSDDKHMAVAYPSIYTEQMGGYSSEVGGTVVVRVPVNVSPSSK